MIKQCKKVEEKSMNNKKRVINLAGAIEPRKGERVFDEERAKRMRAYYNAGKRLNWDK